MTASGAGEAVEIRRPAADSNGSVDPARPGSTVARDREGRPGGGAAAGDGDGGPWSHVIAWAARLVIPSLAPAGLVSVFADPLAGPADGPSRPSHFLLQRSDDPESPSTITPVTSRALDLYEPFGRIAEGNVQLWGLDGSLTHLFAPGTSAVGAPLAVGPRVRAALTLFRPPDGTPFSLDDLMRLESLAEGAPASDAAPHEETNGGARTWRPAVLTPSAHVIRLRHLMRDLMDGDTQYDVARRLAQAAQAFFDARSCVVYFVDPAERTGRRASSATATATGGESRPRLLLAASVGSGVLLTPPWLEPAERAGSETLFASSGDGTVLMADLPEDAPWIERTTSDDLLVALPLRSDGKLVAILGMHGAERLQTMETITAENFALIGANALLVSRRRDADQSSILVLRSEVARNRLAHDATIALLDAGDVAGGLAAHANRLVPGIADGYLLYLDERVPWSVSPGVAGRDRSGPVYSHWRDYTDIATQTWVEAWVDHRLLSLANTSPTEPLPFLLGDASDHPAAGDQVVDEPIEPLGAGRSVAAVPLVRAGRAFGTLVLVTTEHARRYGQWDLGLIASLAEPVARLLSAEETRLRRLDRPAVGVGSIPPAGSGDATLLADLATRFISPIEIDEVVRLTARALARHLGDWCVVELPGVNGDRPVTSGAHADPNQRWPDDLWAHLIQNRDASRGPAKVMRSGQSDLSLTLDWVTPITAEDHDEGAICPALIPASSISAPILSGDQAVIGTISCFRSRPAAPFTLGDLATLESVAGIVGDVIAVARSRRSEREVGRRQHWLAESRTQLMAQLADGVIVIDGHQRIAFANDQARRLHGGADLPANVGEYLAIHQPRDLDGTPFTAQTFPLNVALSTGSRQHGFWRLRPRDDGSVTVVAAASPIRGEDGAVSGAVLSLYDLTEEDEWERIRRQYLVELSDELRIPIASIKGWSQYLTQRTTPPGVPTPDSRAVDAIARQTRLLQQLIERLIAASQSHLTEGSAMRTRRLEGPDA